MRTLVIVLSLISAFGCSRRPGLNFDCKWVSDPAFLVDLNNDAHVNHLLDDIRAAEELDIRHRDRVAGYRLVETFGIVSRHGRDGSSKNRANDRQERGKCLAALLPTIATRHGVTPADIDAVRARLAERGFDLPVTIPVVSLLLFALTRFIRWLRTRFEADESLAWIFASLVGSLLIPVVILGMGWLWAMLVEVVRLGNEHVGYRERTEGLQANFLVLFVLSIGATWIASTVTAIRKRAAAASVPSPRIGPTYF